MACSAMYGLALRECWPDTDLAGTEMGQLDENGVGGGGGPPPLVAAHAPSASSAGATAQRNGFSSSGSGAERSHGGSGNIAMSEAHPLTGRGSSAAPSLAGVV